MEKYRRLYRSRQDKMLAGVSGGLADYLEIDSTIVRIVFVILFFASGGFALLLYIVMAIIIPLEPLDSDKGKTLQAEEGDREGSETGTGFVSQERGNRQFFSDIHIRWIIAAVLILVGFNVLTRQFFPFFHLQWSAIWPIALIVIGLYLIIKPPNSFSGDRNENSDSEPLETKKKEVSVGRLITGMIIVVLGMLFLAHVLGWVTVQIGAIWNLWPLLLIFIGISLVSPWRWVTLLVGVMMALVIVWALLTGVFVDQRAVERRDINIEREEYVQAASLDIKMGAGRLRMSGGDEQLVEGSLESDVMDLRTLSEVRDNVQYVSLHGSGSWNWFTSGRGTNEMNVRLNNDTPMDINISTGAMDMNLDLRDIIATSVNVDTGASSMVLDLGDRADESKVRINAGASSIRISLPREVGSRVRVDSGLSSVNLQDFNQVESRIYESENYAEAEKKINIEVNMGVSSFDVDWR